MKAELFSNGTFCISSETELESYAIRKWLETRQSFSTPQIPIRFEYTNPHTGAAVLRNPNWMSIPDEIEKKSEITQSDNGL